MVLSYSRAPPPVKGRGTAHRPFVQVRAGNQQLAVSPGSPPDGQPFVPHDGGINHRWLAAANTHQHCPHANMLVLLCVYVVSSQNAGGHTADADSTD